MVSLAVRRNLGVDVLRGFSILIVVTHHISLRVPFGHTLIGPVLPAPLIEVVARDGYDAVMMFFVISGFLITMRCIQTFGSLDAIDSRAFYLHRAGRILPCLLALLIILSLLSVIGPSYLRFTHPSQSLGMALVAVLTCCFNWYEGITGWAPANWDVLWSLSIEEAFYLLFPLVCLIGAPARILLLAGLVIAGPLDHAALKTGSEIWREKAYLPGFGAVATGVLAALLSDKIRLNAWRARGLCVVGACLAASALLDTGLLWRHLTDWTVMLLTVGIAALMVGLSALGKAGERTAPARGLGWLGKGGALSYEIYLTHMFLVLPAVSLLTWLGISTNRGGIVLYVLIPPLCWGLGAVVARFWSRPAARWCDRVAKTALHRASPV